MSTLVNYILIILIGTLIGTPDVRQIAPPTRQQVRVPDFKLTNQTLFDGLAVLSSKNVPLALGFEELLRPKFTDPPLDNPRFNLEMQDGTPEQIIDALCALDRRYTWSRDALTINVYPQATVGDPTYLLNRRLDNLEVANLPDPDHALLAIIRQLPPPEEQVAYAGIGGDSSYAALWTTAFHDLTVRQAINRLAEHMGSRSQWIFSGSRDFRAFAFFKAGFNPRPDENPDGKPGRVGHP